MNTIFDSPFAFSNVGEVVTTYKRTTPVNELPKIERSRDAVDQLRLIWERDTIELHECFYVLYVNRGNKVIGWAQISRGGVAGTVADPKIIFQKGLLINACGLILAHNHPSGQLTPSQADINLTKKVKDAGTLLEMTVLDHVILTADSYYSFADEGIL